MLYQLETGGAGLTPEAAFSLFCDSFDAPVDCRPFAMTLVCGVRERLGELDGRLNAASEHWRTDRMSLVDRNILRQALFEMLCLPEIPHKVSLNEAIDLGKRFGSEESGAFINGILDHIHQTMAGEDPPLPEPDQEEADSVEKG